MSNPWTPHLAEASSILVRTIVTHVVESEKGLAYCAAIQEDDNSWKRLCEPRPKREYESWAEGFAYGAQEAAK